MTEAAAVVFEQVEVWRTTRGERRALLQPFDWRVELGEHWAIAGPNGAGKTTLLRIASAQGHPSRGSATVLGGRLGRVPLAKLRREIGLVEPAFGRRFYPDQSVLDVVLTGIAGTVILVEEVGTEHVERARKALGAIAAIDLAGRLFATCSEGERARVLLARALVGEARMLVLDEPAAGLDLPGRLMLLDSLELAIVDRPGLTTLAVTHDLESLPPHTTHLLLLKGGAVVASGRVEEVFTGANVAACFDLPLELAERVVRRRVVP